MQCCNQTLERSSLRLTHLRLLASQLALPITHPRNRWLSRISWLVGNTWGSLIFLKTRCLWLRRGWIWGFLSACLIRGKWKRVTLNVRSYFKGIKGFLSNFWNRETFGLGAFSFGLFCAQTEVWSSLEADHDHAEIFQENCQSDWAPDVSGTFPEQIRLWKKKKESCFLSHLFLLGLWKHTENLQLLIKLLVWSLSQSVITSDSNLSEWKAPHADAGLCWKCSYLLF